MRRLNATFSAPDPARGALRGDGPFIELPCGVRAEVAAAAARLYSAAVAMHAVDAGVCLVTGCGGGPVNTTLACEPR